MKVYVAEQPESCLDCPCHNGEHGHCQITGKFVCDYIPKSCPLQSLTDYTKQVRKEVCEKFVDKFMMEYTMGDKPVEDIIYEVKSQIQGDKVE